MASRADRVTLRSLCAAKDFEAVPVISGFYRLVHLDFGHAREAFERQDNFLDAQGDLVPEVIRSERRLTSVRPLRPHLLAGYSSTNQPAMLLPAGYDRWLDPAKIVDELPAMLKPYDAGLMGTYEVSRSVNSVQNDAPESLNR